jgi:predicted glycosyltransferase
MSRRVMLYSHDTFGLGNIRRMVAVATDLLDTVEDVSVLLVTGSPMVQSFRLRPGLDYIKLPCLSRISRDAYSAKSLGTGIEQTMRLRAALIEAATRDFAPDAVLIDKKPDGVQRELRGTLELLRRELPKTQVALVLRDILDTPEATIPAWNEKGYPELIRDYFDSILVLGSPDVFDSRSEYCFSPELRRKTEFCGYLRRCVPLADYDATRAAWLAAPGERLVLVTPGGGEDGYPLIQNYLAGLGNDASIRSVVITGPEMSASQRAAIAAQANAMPTVSVHEFTPDLPALMGAAEVVVSMAGYNTVCEILSLGKRCVTVPRVHPVQEQWIRAERLQARGLLTAIHPESLTPESMRACVLRELDASVQPLAQMVDLGGLEGVRHWVRRALPVSQWIGGELCKAASLTY